MSTLSQLKHGFNRFLDNLAEGWHEFSEKAGHALTRFSPKHSEGGVDDIVQCPGIAHLNLPFTHRNEHLHLEYSPAIAHVE